MTGSHDDIRDRALARIGTTINAKYRLDRLAGIGGMAVVYAATHRNGRPVALKLLHPELSSLSVFATEGGIGNVAAHILANDLCERRRDDHLYGRWHVHAGTVRHAEQPWREFDRADTGSEYQRNDSADDGRPRSRDGL